MLRMIVVILKEVLLPGYKKRQTEYVAAFDGVYRAGELISNM